MRRANRRNRPASSAWKLHDAGERSGHQGEPVRSGQPVGSAITASISSHSNRPDALQPPSITVISRSPSASLRNVPDTTSKNLRSSSSSSFCEPESHASQPQSGSRPRTTAGSPTPIITPASPTPPRNVDTVGELVTSWPSRNGREAGDSGARKPKVSVGLLKSAILGG